MYSSVKIPKGKNTLQVFFSQTFDQTLAQTRLDNQFRLTLKEPGQSSLANMKKGSGFSYKNKFTFLTQFNSNICM